MFVTSRVIFEAALALLLAVPASSSAATTSPDLATACDDIVQHSVRQAMGRTITNIVNQATLRLGGGPTWQGFPRIYVADATGARLVKLANNAADPAWSPDGTKIAFVRERGDTAATIAVMNADGSVQTDVAATGGIPQMPTWSPDGSKIAFTDAEAGVIAIGGADGSKLATASMLVDVDPNAALVALPGQQRLAWSPDSRKIAFVTWDGESLEIYAMNVDGSARTQLTDSATDAAPTDAGPPRGPQSIPPTPAAPAWSPDGAKIAFIRQPTGPNVPGGLYVMNADGSNPTQLTDRPPFSGPAWSPDGARLMFVSWQGSDADIYLVNADGSNLTNLTPGNAAALEPDWSPDGTRIAFTSYDANEGNGNICVMDADGSGKIRVTGTEWDDRSPRWSPDGTRLVFQSHPIYVGD